MDRTSKTEPSASAESAWRSVCIAPPRRPAGKLYVTIARALIIALEHGGGYGAAMYCRDRGALREYVIGRRRLDGGVFEPVLRGGIPRTARLETDHVRALEFFEEILEDDPGLFFGGRLARATKRLNRRAHDIGDAE